MQGGRPNPNPSPNPSQAAAMQGVTDQRQAMALNEAIGDAEQVAGYPP